MFHFTTLLLLSLLLFLYGFFPLPNNIGKFPNSPPNSIGNIVLNNKTYKPHFQKTVLIIIDALRWDFATPALMPLTMQLTEKQGCINKIRVESPTVTLPRIKALTTGSIPQYIDLIRNLASSEILSDSWLHSAKDYGLKIVFYGDNTWEKLFPNFFSRSEGTTSFFVWDFVEVDNNVTKNVNWELERTDWDVMILHYLGLDHIGHVLGPFSNRMTPKLQEMDQIIYKIYEKTRHSNTVILVTGDHGMRDAGGHGGTSYPEVTVPLITINHNCKSSAFLQTDIPANLAILLGLNIPSTSIGKVNKDFLNHLNIEEYLYAVRYNTEILLKKNNLCENIFDNATNFHENFLMNNNPIDANEALNLYQNCSKQITEELYRASSKQNLHSLILAVILMLNILFLVMLNLFSLNKFNLEIVFLYSVFIFQFFEVLFGFILIILIVFALVKLKFVLNYLKFLVSFNFLQIFLIFTSILQPITFISTSFIEEEHYFWIYVSVTLVLIMFIHELSQINVAMLKSIKNFNFLKLLLVLLVIRFSMDLNSTTENSVQNDNNWANILIKDENYLLHQTFFIINLLSIFLIVKSNECSLINISCIINLTSIFILKSTPYHNALLGKLIWGQLLLKKIVSNFSWRNVWILVACLLIKPHNVILLPFAVLCADSLKSKLQKTEFLSITSYILSNCFYFLQGHRNSLASVDISIGYTGLNDYYPFLVITQVLIHTYTFPVLFQLIFVQQIPSYNKRKLFWQVLLVLRVSVVLCTSIVIIFFRHHLFVWSVFAPKLFIESVHTGFLFIEICLWYFFIYLKKVF
ncbi:unnamed protein product [Ceutorhynchus assimilis]|uniref:GPI ethanolamine phosphate transferase 2 C-terminal domain-containing protein n=1 Tax=Ceutorhynchus assimilis TaxID=467358 RepID=A0A9N9MI30_9CUCU|nr:unnamed protein product [Ceutorhynchus assimilis]